MKGIVSTFFFEQQANIEFEKVTSESYGSLSFKITRKYSNKFVRSGAHC